MICLGNQLASNDKTKTRENCKDITCPAFNEKEGRCLFAKQKENKKNGK